jgi:transcription initiation factor TFIIIB Brf1 subunit/transcription initiation factor TFIIB
LDRIVSLFFFDTSMFAPRKVPRKKSGTTVATHVDVSASVPKPLALLDDLDERALQRAELFKKYKRNNPNKGRRANPYGRGHNASQVSALNARYAPGAIGARRTEDDFFSHNSKSETSMSSSDDDDDDDATIWSAKGKVKSKRKKSKKRSAKKKKKKHRKKRREARDSDDVDNDNDVDDGDCQARCPGCESSCAPVNDHERGVMSCEACGHVIREDELVAHPERRESQMSGGTATMIGSRVSVHSAGPADELSYNERQQRVAKSVAYALASRIGDGYDPYVDQALSYMQAFYNGHWRGGQSGRLLVAACMYIALRQNRCAVSLQDVALASDNDLYTIGRLYKEVKAALHIKLEHVDLCNSVARGCAVFQELSDVQRATMAKYATRILELCKLSVAEGRKPAPIVGAAISLAMRIDDAVAPDDYEEALDKIADKLRASTHTMTQRRREMARVLFAAARAQLPYGASIRANHDIHRHIAPLFDHIDFMQPPNRSSKEQQRRDDAVVDDGDGRRKDEALPLPPAFQRSVSMRSRTIAIVERARALIDGATQRFEREPTCEEIDFDDVADEQERDQVRNMVCLVLLGVPVKTLESGAYKDAHIQALSFTAAVSDSTQLTDADMADDELSNFIRSDAETKLVTRMRNAHGTDREMSVIVAERNQHRGLDIAHRRPQKSEASSKRSSRLAYDEHQVHLPATKEKEERKRQRAASSPSSKRQKV